MALDPKKKKRIHDFDVKEISLVDGPAILKPIAVVKALGGKSVGKKTKEDVTKTVDSTTLDDGGKALEETTKVEEPIVEEAMSLAPVHEALMQEKLDAIKRGGVLVAEAASALDTTKEKKDALWDSIWPLQEVIWSLRDLSPLLTTKALELKELATTKTDECAALDATAHCMVQLKSHLRETSQKGSTAVADEVKTTEIKTEKSLAERMSTEEGRKALEAELSAAGFEAKIETKPTAREKALEDKIVAQDAKIATLVTTVETATKALEALGKSGADSKQSTADAVAEEKTKAIDKDAKYRNSPLNRDMHYR